MSCTLRPWPTSKQLLERLFSQDDIPAEFFDCEDAVRFLIYADLHCTGILMYTCESRNAQMHVYLKHKDIMNSETIRNIAALCSTHIISDRHPHRIQYAGNDPLFIQGLQSNLYYPKGKIMQRIVENYRYLIPDNAFDEQGYLINQDLMENISFGYFNTKDKGCGWIAGYNLLKLNGKEHTMQEVAEGLQNYAFMEKIAGQNVYGLMKYLKGEGLPLNMQIIDSENCESVMADTSSGIILYVHTRGAHYTCYKKMRNGRYHFYNAVYGSRYQVISASAFMNKYPFIKRAVLLSVKE